MLISIVITNYNGASLLKKNLPRVLEAAKKSKLDCEVIVVDDASTDESRDILERIKNQESRIKVIYKEKNEGFASTVNAGFRAASGEIIFSIKSDSYPEGPEYFGLMLEHFKDQKVFAVSSALETIEDGKREIRGQGVIYWSKGFFLHKRAEAALSGQDMRASKVKIYSAWADGSASAFRKEYYDRIGGFDQLYDPFYWEDVDLGYRGWKAGYIIEYEPKAVLVHQHEEGVIARHYTSQQITDISLRNQFIFAWKNADFGNLLRFYYWEIYQHLAAVRRGQQNFVKIYWWAAVRWPEILRKRLLQKQINELSDKQVLEIFSKI